jgi:hypothetical protein
MLLRGIRWYRTAHARGQYRLKSPKKTLANTTLSKGVNRQRENVVENVKKDRSMASHKTAAVSRDGGTATRAAARYREPW